MPKSHFPLRSILAALALSATLAGCVVVPARGYYRGDYYGAAVTIAPPTPQVEVYGTAPAPGYVWLGGYWNWAGGRHVWVGGHWAAPRPGFRWQPNRWVHRADGWHMTGGRWVRR